MTKEAEVRIRDITNHYGWHRHKYGDVRYCQFCHSPLPKSENAPDFYVSQVGDWIEAKNNDASGVWNCSELFADGTRQNQRKFLTENGGWLFIELSTGRSIDEKGAFLVPWEDWMVIIEPQLQAAGMKSIRLCTTYNKDGSVRRIGADNLIGKYALTWITKVGWTIPPYHDYWFIMQKKLEEQLEFVKKEMQCDGN